MNVNWGGESFKSRTVTLTVAVDERGGVPLSLATTASVYISRCSRSKGVRVSRLPALVISNALPIFPAII